MIQNPLALQSLESANGNSLNTRRIVEPLKPFWTAVFTLFLNAFNLGKGGCDSNMHNLPYFEVFTQCTCSPVAHVIPSLTVIIWIALGSSKTIPGAPERSPGDSKPLSVFPQVISRKVGTCWNSESFFISAISLRQSSAPNNCIYPGCQWSLVYT